ncbi:hypothetical protein INR49_029037 [Caranx melampygus]|nr:hypothetical protein INR49_029037 [Caranx melampygus]
MSKRREYTSIKMSKGQATELATLIVRLQRNADQVEKNILRSEELLSADTERDRKRQRLLYQKEIADNLSEAEGLVKNLFMDVDKSKKLQHPQALEIEKDVSNLHDRWVKDCAIYRDLYGQVLDMQLSQKIGWGPLLDGKLRKIKTETYGPKLTDVEKQIAEHNILHKEIEAYNSQLQPSSVSPQEQYSTLKDKYAELLELSQCRHNHLASLYDYIQSCNKELVYLSGQQDRIIQRDWSDRMIDPPGVRTEYEKFKTNGLVSHEREVNQLKGEGDRLTEKNHPGASAIKMHRDAVQAEWQAFLNLCLAQEKHLDNIDNYRKFQLDAETLSESLDRLNNNLDAGSLGSKSNSEILLALEGDEPAMKRNDQRLASLKELSSSVVPLKLRRTHPTKHTTAVALCDWNDDEGIVRRGEKLTLKSNSSNREWELQTSSGRTKTLPGACFVIPAPDAEALDRVDSLEKALTELKSRRSTLMYSSKTRTVEVIRSERTVTVHSAPEDPRAAQFASDLDRIIRSLAQTEKEVLSRMRAPIDNRTPTQDLAKRLEELESHSLAVRRLESEKSGIQREMGSILARTPLGPTASTLPVKLSVANHKIDHINSLIDSFKKKATASLYLEKQMKNVEGIVSGFENQLAEDGTILFLQQTNAIQRRSQDLQTMRKAVASQKDAVNQLGKDLDLTEQACSSLKQSFSEYCPDIRRQETEKVVEDIKRKSSDLDRVKSLSRELQHILNEKNLLNLYSEVSAENSQLLSQLGTAKTIMARNEEKYSQVVVTQQLHLQSQRKDLEESNSLKRELSEEVSRRLRIEKDMETYRKRLVSLRSRRGVERVEEKEVVQYYRDPNLELQLQSLKKQIQDEILKRSRFSSEIELMNVKIIKVENQVTKIVPKLVTKVLTEYERDAVLENEATRIRETIHRIRREFETADTQIVCVKNEVTVLSQQAPKIRHRVVKKEVVRVEKDPEMLRSVHLFQSEISEVESRCKSLHDSIYSLRSQISTLERLIPTIEPKIVIKEVRQVQQDHVLVEESKKLRIALQEERDEIAILMKDLSTLRLRYSEVENVRQRVEVKEIINEVYKISHETELELVRLRKELQEYIQRYTVLEREISTVTTSVTTVRAQPARIEYKEVTKEVIKEEASPEDIRELQRLRNQISRLQVNYDSTIELFTSLCRERDELKIERSRVEIKVVTKDIIKYENDPLLEKEVERLRRSLREEIQLRRNMEEIVCEISNQYIILERQVPEERIIVQEVVRLKKDQRQILEHDRLRRLLDDEVQARRLLETEVRELRSLVVERENRLAQADDRQRKIIVESELREIRTRIYEFESNPKPIEEKIIIEEVLKVERDPNLDRLSDGIRIELESERSSVSRLEREICSLKVKLELLEKEKSIEKVVYREVIRIEKDTSLLPEMEHLRELISHERKLRLDQEEGIQNYTIKIAHIQTERSVVSHEEVTLISTRDALYREKEDLLRELKTLESQREEISYTFQQQSKLVSERSQVIRQKSLKLSTQIEQLEREILSIKDTIHQKTVLITELQSKLMKEDHHETHTSETNLSTKITILDPETGKDLSPYEAYVQGVIERSQYIHLSEMECDWEEITSTGPSGDTTILQDRKSGKQYSVKDAVRDGRLTQYDLSRYKEGKLSISEFALLVAGETRKPYVPPITSPRSPIKYGTTSPLNSMSSTLRSSYTSLNTHLSGSLTNLAGPTGDELFPISGIYDNTTGTRMSVRSAFTRKLIDADMTLKLLEAQAASGGIVDLGKKDKFSVHKAAEYGLIDQAHMYKLLNAQKAFTGVEDPVTKQRLPIGQAAQKGYIPQENAIRYMEAQYLTGGLVNPAKAGRLSVQEALATNIIDNATANHLQDESSHTKDLVDPITKERITYKQAIDRCRRDVSTGLMLLPAVSTDEEHTPSFSHYQFNSSSSRY